MREIKNRMRKDRKLLKDLTRRREKRKMLKEIKTHWTWRTATEMDSLETEGEEEPVGPDVPLPVGTAAAPALCTQSSQCIDNK